MYTILLIDDDPCQLELIRHIVEDSLHYRAITAQSGREAIEHFLLRKVPMPDLVLVDAIMPDVGGLEVVRTIRRSDKSIPIVMLSTHGDSSPDALLHGVDEIIQKPINLLRLDIAIKRQIERVNLNREVRRLSRYHQGQVCFNDILTQNIPLQKVVTLAKRAAATNHTIFISGEQGTGKELLARAIHGASPRSGKTFEVIDGKTRFNHEASIEQRISEALERAEGGTLLVRHLDAFSAKEQARIFEYIKANQAYHSFRDRRGDIRLIVVSCIPLSLQLKEGIISEYIYRQLQGVVLEIPQLKDRKEDIPLLAEYFVQRIAASEGRDVRTLQDEAIEFLCRYHWGGNVSELQQMIRTCVIQSETKTITAMDILKQLNEKVFKGAAVSDETSQDYLSKNEVYAALRAPSFIAQDGNVKPINELEAEVIQYAIKHYRGRMSEVARRLGIGRSTLYRKIQDYNLENSA